MVAYKVRTVENGITVFTDGRTYIPFDGMSMDVKHSYYGDDNIPTVSTTYAFQFFRNDAFIGTLYLDDTEDSFEFEGKVYRPTKKSCKIADFDSCINDGCSKKV